MVSAYENSKPVPDEVHMLAKDEFKQLLGVFNLIDTRRANWVVDSKTVGLKYNRWPLSVMAGKPFEGVRPIRQ